MGRNPDMGFKPKKQIAPPKAEPTKKELAEIKRRKKRKSWTTYRRKVWDITLNQPVHMLPGHNLWESRTVQLDHIISVWRGWKDSIPVEIIGCISNLQYLPSEENGRKSVNCYSSLEHAARFTHSIIHHKG